MRRGGGGRRDRYTYVHGATTMLVLGLLLNTVGIGLFCWLIFTLAVYALPLFVAVSVGIPWWCRCAWRAAGWHLRWRRGARHRTNRVRNDTVRDFARSNCGRVRHPGGRGRLSRPSRHVTDRSAIAGLAPGLRLPRRGLHWRNGVDTLDRLRGAPPIGIGQADGKYVSFRSHGSRARGIIFSTIVVEWIRVDRRAEREASSLSEEVFAPILGALRPGCSYFHFTQIDAVARSILALRRFRADDSAVCRTLFLSLPPNVPTSCVAEPRPATSSPGMLLQHADAPGLLMA